MNTKTRHRKLSLAGAALLLAPLCTLAQTARVGDLVEYVSGLGPTLAEIVVGPDASGYVVVLLPTGKQAPVNTSKLRLVQQAGAPNAAMAVGEPVSWVDGNVRESGSVTKVNGKYCQVKTPSSTTVGWVECSELKLRNAAAPTQGMAAPAAVSPVSAVAIKAQGEWQNADGSVKLELQNAGKCFMSLGPLSAPCTYRQTAQGITVNMDGEDMVLAANDDGSLSSVGGTDGMSIRLKKK